MAMIRNCETLLNPCSAFQTPTPRVCGRERFSSEIWRNIAMLLPRRDLKSLLFVPHIPSRVASQLLFRRIDLHFGGTMDWEELLPLESHPQPNRKMIPETKSADILTRIILDPGFASLVRSLRIFSASFDQDRSMAFQTG
jgi:hypothetical protein